MLRQVHLLPRLRHRSGYDAQPRRSREMLIDLDKGSSRVMQPRSLLASIPTALQVPSIAFRGLEPIALGRMFLIPSHIRKVLQSVLTENAHEGPHTALLLLAHGQVLCTASNADPDWYSSGSTGDDNGDDDGGSDDDDEDGDEEDEDDENSRGEGGEDDEDEPYIPTPERNRMLRGIVKSQLLETDAFPDRSVPGGKKERGSIKIECDVSQLEQSRSTRFGSA
jgi:hypothetical protein